MMRLRRFYEKYQDRIELAKAYIGGIGMSLLYLFGYIHPTA